MPFALVTLEYPPFHGGVAEYASGLVEASQGGIEPFVVGEERYARVGPWKWRTLIPWLRSLGRSHEAIIVSHLLPVGSAVWIARLLGGARYAVVIHGLDLRRACRSAFKRWLVHRILRGAALVVANSCFTSDEIVAFDPSIQPLVLTPAVRQGKPDPLPSRADARRRFHLPQDAFVLLSVARLVPRKGIDRIIQALELLPPHMHLAVVGEGADRQRLEALAAPLAERIHFFGALSAAERDAAYAMADAFILMPRAEGDDVEGFGVVFLEAARAGLPVIAGKSGGVGEAVLDRQTGRVVDPTNTQAIAEAISEVAQHPAEAAAWGTRGAERVQREFLWSERWTRLKQALAGESGSGSGLISVVIPAYNHASELQTCLQSLERQTDRSFEVIVVDDASTDGLGDRLQTVHTSFSLHLIRHATNQGAPAARNTGAAEAQGEYVIFLDADIVLEPDALAAFRRALELHPEADFAYSSFFFGWKKFSAHAFDAHKLAERNYIHTSALIRRRAVIPFDPSLKKFQDWDVWLTLAEQGKRGVWIPRTLFRIKPRASGYSRWLPRLMHRLPWPIGGWMPSEIQRYREAELILRNKHALPLHKVG